MVKRFQSLEDFTIFIISGFHLSSEVHVDCDLRACHFFSFNINKKVNMTRTEKSDHILIPTRALKTEVFPI